MGAENGNIFFNAQYRQRESGFQLSENSKITLFILSIGFFIISIALLVHIV